MEIVQTPKVEEMTLDKKLEFLRKFNPMENYDEGRYIDA